MTTPADDETDPGSYIVETYPQLVVARMPRDVAADPERVRRVTEACTAHMDRLREPVQVHLGDNAADFVDDMVRLAVSFRPARPWRRAWWRVARRARAYYGFPVR